MQTLYLNYTNSPKYKTEVSGTAPADVEAASAYPLGVQVRSGDAVSENRWQCLKTEEWEVICISRNINIGTRNVSTPPR